MTKRIEQLTLAHEAYSQNFGLGVDLENCRDNSVFIFIGGVYKSIYNPRPWLTLSLNLCNCIVSGNLGRKVPERGIGWSISAIQMFARVELYTGWSKKCNYQNHHWIVLKPQEKVDSSPVLSIKDHKHIVSC